MKFNRYLNEDWIEDERISFAKKHKSQHEKTLKDFKKDTSLYIIPKGFRNNLYDIALKQLDDYYKGKLQLHKIFYEPDNTLRNAIKLWTIHKKGFKKK